MAAAPPRARERKRAAAAEMSDEDEGEDAELELECDLRVEQVTLPASLGVRRPRAPVAIPSSDSLSIHWSPQFRVRVHMSACTHASLADARMQGLPVHVDAGMRALACACHMVSRLFHGAACLACDSCELAAAPTWTSVSPDAACSLNGRRESASSSAAHSPL